VDNLPGLNVWCELSYSSLIEPFFFEGTIIGPMYRNMLRKSILPVVHQLYGNKPFYFQQGGAPPHYHLRHQKLL
jgi:hypothetical protein